MAGYKRYRKSKRSRRFYKRYRRYKRGYKKYKKRKTKLITYGNKRTFKLRYVLPVVNATIQPSMRCNTLRFIVNALESPGYYIFNNLENCFVDLETIPATYSPKYTIDNYIGVDYRHFPMGLDDVSKSYRKYCVVGAKVTLRYVPERSTKTTNLGYVIGMRTTVEDPPLPHQLGSVLSVLENGKYNYRLETANPDGPTYNGYKRKIVCNFSAKKLFGKKNPSTENDLCANFGSSPKNLAYVDVFFGRWADYGDALNPADLIVQIDYIVKATERKDYELLTSVS